MNDSYHLGTITKLISAKIRLHFAITSEFKIRMYSPVGPLPLWPLASMRPDLESSGTRVAGTGCSLLDRVSSPHLRISIMFWRTYIVHGLFECLQIGLHQLPLDLMRREHGHSGLTAKPSYSWAGQSEYNQSFLFADARNTSEWLFD